MGLADKLRKDKKFRDMVVTDIKEKSVSDFFHAGSISLNLLLSGKVNGGIPEGKITMLAAPRAHGKSVIGMISAGNAQKKGHTVVWIDSEFSFDPVSAEMFGMDINSEKLILIQDNSIEKVQSAILNLFQDYDSEKDGKVFMVVDSIGALITSKTVEDSLSLSDKQDMTEAKKKNKLSKLILGVSGKNNITVVLINHLYVEIGAMYSTGAISGGSGAQYVSSSILKITSKSKDKDSSSNIQGNVFTAYTDKGRLAKENSKLRFRLSYEDGINPYYGLIEDAIEGGYIEKPSLGWYSRPCIENDKKFREKDIYSKDFWTPIFKNTDLVKYLEKKYSYIDTFETGNQYSNELNLEGDEND